MVIAYIEKIYRQANIYSQSKRKKRTSTPINSKTSYRNGTVPINMDYCVLLFDALKSFWASVYMVGLYLPLFFSIN